MTDREVLDAEKALADLVKADYDATHRALAGFVASGGQLRAIGIAAWGVVYAGAVQAESVPIAFISIPLILVFALADGYYSALYRQTLDRSRWLEAVLGDYANSLGIHSANQEKVDRALAQLEERSFGVHRSMVPVNQQAGRWYIPRPVRVAAIYGLLLVCSIATTVVFAATRHSDKTCSAEKPCPVLTTAAPRRAVTVTVTTPASPSTHPSRSKGKNSPARAPVPRHPPSTTTTTP